MRHTSRFSLAILAIYCFVFLVGTAASQTLADAAREQQKKKTPSATGKVYTNDSLEFHEAPAEPAPSATTGATGDDTAAAPDAAPSDDKKSDDKKDEGKAKAAQELKDKVAKDVAEIAQLKRELDVLQRENHLRTAVYYADAGSRLRDEKKFADDDRKYAADIATKQKAIVDTQADLDRLREEARRAGVSVS